jgi:hypothetical protein
MFSLIFIEIILGSSCPQRFSATANQLLENLKRRSGNPTSMEAFVKHYN